MALPRVREGRLDSEDSSYDFWNSMRGGEYGDYMEEEQDSKMSKLRLNSILFAIFQVLLVLIFIRAIETIDKNKNGYEHLRELCQGINSSIPI